MSAAHYLAASGAFSGTFSGALTSPASPASPATSTTATTATTSAAGFTLIEVLLAILILALGAAGVIAMQLHALRLAQQTALQASAVQFAGELAEHIQAGPAEAYLMHAGASAANATGTCYDHPCDAPALAAFILNDWRQRLQTALPQARATICRDSPVHSASGSLRWECDHNGNSGIVIKIGWTSHLQPDSNADAPVLVMATGS